MKFLVSIEAHDMVEVEAATAEAARVMVESNGASEYRSVWYESEVTGVTIAPPEGTR